MSVLFGRRGTDGTCVRDTCTSSGMPSPPVVLNVVTNTYRWSSSIMHVTVLCTALVIYIAVVVLDDACVIAMS